MKIFTRLLGGAAALALVLGLSEPIAAFAATAPSLETAASFSVLGAAAMSTANPTTVSGDLGLSPGLAVSRTGTWTVRGSEYFGPLSLAGTAQADALDAFNNLAGQTSVGGWDVSPWSPLPGVYTAALDTTFTGTITLNGNYNDVWVFQVGRDMTFSGSVVLAGNAQACNVFFQVGRDATIGLGSTFVGTLIASGNFTSASGATVNGRIISLNGTFLAMNGVGGVISGPTCAVAPTPINGACGTASQIYPYTAVSFGSDPLCSAGTPSLSPTFPTPGNSVIWTCAGINGGSSSGNCTATVGSIPPTPVNGICGTAAQPYSYTVTSFGSDPLCSAGTPSLSPTFPTPGNSVIWTCAGINGGSSSGNCTTAVSSAPPVPATLTLVKSIVGGK